MMATKPTLPWTRRLAVGLAVAALLGGCGTEPRVAAIIVVAPDSATLLWPGDTIRFTGTVLDEDGRTMPDVAITWTSGDESVVSVDANGLVTAVGNGVASVRAAVEGKELVASVTVDMHRGPLLKFYEATGGPGWVNSENWGTDAPIDTWYGVTT